jgi:hypothetical protein
MDLTQILTFTALVTPPGAVIAAVVIRYIAELAKRYVTLPGDVLALIVVAVLYVAAAVAVPPGNADGWLNLVWTAFLALGGAIGFDAVLAHVTELRNPPTA